MKKLLAITLFASLFVLAGCNSKTTVSTPSDKNLAPLDQKNNGQEIQASSASTTSENITPLDAANSPEKTSENWVNTPAEIKSISQKNNETSLSLDILTRNPDFLPGQNEYFINQNTKLRDASISTNTKAYLCGAGPDNNITTADVSTSLASLLDSIKNKIAGIERPTYYFDIEGNNVQTIYEQCLP